MKVQRTITIYDISQRSGVSIATVSRVINGSDVVSEETRKKVLAVIAECGYTPNAFARGLGLNTMNTVGILCADVADPFMAQAISFLEKGLRENGYDSLLCCTGSLLKDRQKGLDLLLSKHVDGIILVGSNYVSLDREKNAYILSAAAKTPILILNAMLEGENIYCSYCDDRTATLNAAQMLLKAGRSRILYLYQAKTYSGVKKLEGYQQAYRLLGLPLNKELMVECKADAGIAEIKALLESVARQGIFFDAIMTATDDMALGAVKYAKAAERKIPEELPIVGYNNSSLCLCTDPELSSVDNKLFLICENCVTTLMGILAGEEMPKSRVFPSEFIQRGTTAIPR